MGILTSILGFALLSQDPAKTYSTKFVPKNGAVEIHLVELVIDFQGSPVTLSRNVRKDIFEVQPDGAYKSKTTIREDWVTTSKGRQPGPNPPPTVTSYDKDGNKIESSSKPETGSLIDFTNLFKGFMETKTVVPGQEWETKTDLGITTFKFLGEIEEDKLALLSFEATAKITKPGFSGNAKGFLKLRSSDRSIQFSEFSSENYGQPNAPSAKVRMTIRRKS